MGPNDSNVRPGEIHPYGALPVPRLTPELLGLVRSGVVYSLAVPLFEGIPLPTGMVPFTVMPKIRHGDNPENAPVSWAVEVISMTPHVGTHIDALCHIGEWQDAAGEPGGAEGQIRLYAGPGETVPATEQATESGYAHLSIAEMPPVVARGLLLDVAGCKGVEVLPPAYAITPEDIETTLAEEGVQVRPGTAVLIRTGYYRYMRENRPEFREAMAGLGLEAAQFLAGQGMLLAGADTLSVEAIPPPDHRVHRYLQVHHGIPHLEVLYLDRLAAERVYEFLLVVTPLRILGATGSWVHPIAIA